MIEKQNNYSQYTKVLYGTEGTSELSFSVGLLTSVTWIINIRILMNADSEQNFSCIDENDQ